MLRRLSSLMIIGLVMAAIVLPITAEDIVEPQHSDPVWQARYWNNTQLSGTPVLQRTEVSIDHDWGTASPKAGVVNDNNFSARWTRYIDVTPGTYRFTVQSDDGIRVWVDNTLIVDAWTVHAVQTDIVDFDLNTGHHLITVEYYEATGLATAKVNWYLQSPTQPVTHWRGEYFNNTTLAGAPILVRDDAGVNFNWGTGSPATGVVNSDYFSARWTLTTELSAGMYTFSMTADDGVRLWVNNHLLVDAWKEQAATTYTSSIYVPDTPVTIEVQYFEQMGHAVAQLSWQKTGDNPNPPPEPSNTVIVDDSDAGFVKGGAASGWRTVGEGYNNNLTWTYNNQWSASNYNWARWYPNLQARTYEVFVYIPERYTTTFQARYWVKHADGYTLRTVNQSTNGNSWVSLGTYNFAGNGDEYVSLSDVTYEPYRNYLIAFDAVKWVLR